MWAELFGKGGQLCQAAREGKVRCPLSVRPTSEDVITGNLFMTLNCLQPRWWIPDVLNTALGVSRFQRQYYRRFRIDLWKNRPVFPRELLHWDEGSSQIDAAIAWENEPTTVFWESKYGSNLSPRTSNQDPAHTYPTDQLIRNIRVGLLETGWYNRHPLFTLPPRDFVVVVISPTKGHTLVGEYRDPERLLAAIPHNERLVGLPRQPFIGEITYQEIANVLKRQRQWLTRAERQMVEILTTYLEFKQATSPTRSFPAR